MAGQSGQDLKHFSALQLQQQQRQQLGATHLIFLTNASNIWTNLIHMKVLNAKPENVEREAEIVVQSGRLGAVTNASNMAGRGTDIILGGNA